jgi:hypothetical protein
VRWLHRYALFDLCHITGINRIIQFTSILRQHLEDAKTDPELLQLLREMRQVTYAGMPLETKIEEWAIQEEIRLTVRLNIIASLCG